jgi:acetyl esterase
MTTLPVTHVNLTGLESGALLDRQSHSLLTQIAALTAAVPASDLTVARRRSLMHEAQALLLSSDAEPPVACAAITMDLPSRSLFARLYTPESVSSDALMVFFHGGGWVTGDLDTHHPSLQLLAQHLGCKLLSVQYRKAPEHVFPAACDDAEDALMWAHERLAQLGCTRLLVAAIAQGGIWQRWRCTHMLLLRLRAHCSFIPSQTCNSPTAATASAALARA